MTSSRPFLPSERRGRPGQYLERACYAETLAALQPFGTGKPPADIARDLWHDDANTPKLLTRGAVNPAMNSSAGWAGATLLDATADFVGSLAPQSAAARLMNAGMNVSFAGRKSVKIPRRQGGSKGVTTISWVSEGNPIPVKNYTLDTVTLGPLTKLASIIVLTREMVDFTSGQQTVSTLLREDFAASLDAIIFSDTAAVAGKSPGGLFVGVSPLGATAGGGDSAMLSDLENIAGVIGDNAGSSIAFIAAPRQAEAMQLRLRRADAITIWPCASLASGTVIAVEPRAFAFGIGAEPRIEASIEAVLHMESATPLAIVSGTTTASPVIGAFQQDLVCLKCVLDVAFCMRASGMVAWVKNASWGGT
jgi:hypothetical protein